MSESDEQKKRGRESEVEKVFESGVSEGWKGGGIIHQCDTCLAGDGWIDGRANSIMLTLSGYSQISEQHC